MSQTRERGDGRIFCFSFVFQDHELLEGTTREKRNTKMILLRLFLKDCSVCLN